MASRPATLTLLGSQLGIDADGYLWIAPADDLADGWVQVMLMGAAAGGVLAGNYPSPGFAVNMATQDELEEAISDLAAAVVAQLTDYITAAAVAAAYQPLDVDLTALAGNGAPGTTGKALLLAATAEAARTTLAIGDSVLSDTTLGSDSAINVSWSGNYDDIEILVVGRLAAASASATSSFQFNSDTTSGNYRNAAGSAGTNLALGIFPGSLTNTDRDGRMRVFVSNRANKRHVVDSTYTYNKSNDDTGGVGQLGGTYTPTGRINSFQSVASFATGTRIIVTGRA